LIVTFSNAYNLADGMDGLAGGLAIILSLTIAAFGVVIGVQTWHLGLCLALTTATLPFLMLNAPPAKVFMGDVGALPIGAVIGWLLVRSSEKAVVYPVSFSWLVGAIVLSVVLMAELIPVPLQILSVKIRKKRLFPKTPIHHAFQAAGWPETRVVAMFHIAQAAAAILSLAAILYFRHNWSGE
jgi:phospho-N-acetylmuramoyl-pentapeptide-transferase